ncbi:MAG TPA: hypothetical protein VJW20_05010 [Candidatus Angelobacter sp.]|nr:hypothetical protein [Candidatus Angelobacter sp.]
MPAYFHCPLLRDEKNMRLAKRHDSLSLRTLREHGTDPAELRNKFALEIAGEKRPLYSVNIGLQSCHVRNPEVYNSRIQVG